MSLSPLTCACPQDDAVSQCQTTERDLEEARGALTDHKAQLERCQRDAAAERTERQFLETRISSTQSDCASYVSPSAPLRKRKAESSVRFKAAHNAPRCFPDFVYRDGATTVSALIETCIKVFH